MRVSAAIPSTRLSSAASSATCASAVPLAQVRDLLGHASITTTERYDNQTVANLKIAAAKLERGHAFAPVPQPPPPRLRRSTALPRTCEETSLTRQEVSRFFQESRPPHSGVAQVA